MKINLDQVGKKFRAHWIFKDLTFEVNSKCAIVGPNGSGKSTLLQIISGSMPPSKGKVIFSDGSRIIDVEDVYQYIAYSAPYLELIEEFTLSEIIDFHRSIKGFERDISTDDFIEWIYMPMHKNKQIKAFSSGMKQRLKLALALASSAPVVLLDEPTANFDQTAKDWYLEQMASCQKVVIVASNEPAEYSFCDQVISVY